MIMRLLSVVTVVVSCPKAVLHWLACLTAMLFTMYPLVSLSF